MSCCDVLSCLSADLLLGPAVRHESDTSVPLLPSQMMPSSAHPGPTVRVTFMCSEKKKEHTHVTHTHVTHTHPPVTDARTPTHALLDMQVWVTLSWARLVTQHRQLILTTPPGPPHALRCKQLGGVSGRSVRELIVAVTEWCAPLPQTDRKDPQGTTLVTGFEVLLQKQLKGKQLQKEMAEFIHER